MSLPFKKVLLVGATAGIGLGLAERLVKDNVAVIAVGRRQERLDEFVASNSKYQAYGLKLDLNELDSIPSFAEQTIKMHPDLDCIIFNAGVQYVMDMSKPQTVKVAKIDEEMRINYVSLVALTQAFMPFLQSRRDVDSALIYTTTNLMMVPYPMVFNYCASKSALRSFILSLREQLKADHGKIKVMELIAPLVQTELHNGQPGWGEDLKVGITVEEFVDEAMAGMQAKQNTSAIGFTKSAYEKYERERESAVGPQWESIKKALGSAHEL